MTLLFSLFCSSSICRTKQRIGKFRIAKLNYCNYLLESSAHYMSRYKPENSLTGRALKALQPSHYSGSKEKVRFPF